MTGPLDFRAPRPWFHGEEATYFDYCQRGELRIQFCGDCRRHVFYPRSVCPDCLGGGLEWVIVSGRGRVHTFTIQHRALPGYEGPVPFVLAIVELDEGVRLLSRVACDVDAVHVEMPVAVAWAKIDGDFQVPVFVPADGDAE